MLNRRAEKKNEKNNLLFAFRACISIGAHQDLPIDTALGFTQRKTCQNIFRAQLAIFQPILSLIQKSTSTAKEYSESS